VAKRTSIGLDIATSCVRAAELAVENGEFKLVHFGQFPLPLGAVVDGEVRDVPTVGEALKQLWSAAKFSSKDVSIGVANQRVVVRQVDIPFLPAKDRRESLALMVGDQIPIPVEQAVLDFVHLASVQGADGAAMSRGLLVAAAEDTVDSGIQAAEYAGLNVRDVDLTPFALVRALGAGTAMSLSDDVEAIVDIGASTTVLAIHDHGVPQFVRILLLGGQDVTDRLVSELSVNMPTAESIKRETGLNPGLAYGSVAGSPEGIMTQVTNTLIDEVRGSLDYYLATSASRRLSRVLLTGGGSLVAGLRETLSESIGAPVEQGTVLAALGVGKSGLDAAHLAFADPLSAACVGLAVRPDL
jgi:type IV pilus assembly protein PilM